MKVSLFIIIKDELSNNNLHYQNVIEDLQQAIREEKQENKKLKPIIENRSAENVIYKKELDAKSAENVIFRKELDNLKDVYEKKIDALSKKIDKDKERMQEYKLEIKTKIDVRLII